MNQEQPDWGGQVEGDEYEPVQLDFSRKVMTAEEETNEEEASKWAQARTEEATIDDYESSDDEYVEDNPRATRLRRIRMQAYRSTDWTGPRNPVIDNLMQHPDIACQPRFNDLPMELDEEMRELALGSDLTDDPEAAWRLFWRLNDRNWDFFCAYRRTTQVGNESKAYQQAMEIMNRPLFDHDEEWRVKQLQNMFFIVFQPLLPERKPDKRTGKARPARYLWKSTIRRCMHCHQHRPVHDHLAARKVLREANHVLSSQVFKRNKRNHADVQFDSAKLKHYRENTELMMKLDDKIAKRVAEYRV